jgi:hypothetical protein
MRRQGKLFFAAVERHREKKGFVKYRWSLVSGETVTVIDRSIGQRSVSQAEKTDRLPTGRLRASQMAQWTGQ